MSNTVADVIAKTLIRHEVEYIFGQSNPTALMLAAENNGIRQLLYRTENAAGAMADAYSRVSNKVGVVAAQNGPAATLMVAPMAEAIKASIPMLVIVQEVPASQRDKNAFQELDHFALFDGVSKWTRRLDDADRAAEYIDMAMMAANSGRPGPVVLLLAKDMLVRESILDEFPREQALGYFPLDRPRPDSLMVKQAASLLANAKSPLIIAGGGVHASCAVTELGRLVDVSCIPVATTNMGKGVVAETSPLSLGVAANFMGEHGPATPFLELFENADVVLLIGTRTNENGTDSWTLTPKSARYIHIDVDPMEVGRNYESLRLIGDARSAIMDLVVELEGCNLTQRHGMRELLVERIKDGKRSRYELIESICNSSETPIMPQRIMAELDRIISPDDIVVADASYSSAWVSCFLTAKKPGQRFLTPRGLAGLGWGFPFALGAKLARPSSSVVALVGDGGFAHVWGELEMAIREEIPVIVIVLNNSQLVMQKHGEGLGFGKTTTAIGFSSVDHAAIAKAAGVSGIRIENPEDILPSLDKALTSKKSFVLDVISSPDAFAPLKIFDGDSSSFNVKPAEKAIQQTV